MSFLTNLLNAGDSSTPVTHTRVRSKYFILNRYESAKMDLQNYNFTWRST